MPDEADAFTANAKLKPLETALVREVEAGKDFVPSESDLRAGGTIRGGFLRAMLLGTRLADHPDAVEGGEPRRVKLTAHGVRLANAAGRVPIRITEALDLRGLTARGGGPLPPLELSGCVFDAPLDLGGAQLQSIELAKSRFSCLSAAGARISRSVVIDQCGPPAEPQEMLERYFTMSEFAAWRSGRCGYFPASVPPPSAPAEACRCPLCETEPENWPDVEGGASCRRCCTLDLKSARLGGGLAITRTCLRAPKVVGRIYRTPPLRDAFALNLGRIQVGDSVMIVRSTVFGAVNFVSAEIDDDVWISGGKVLASAERRAMDFQYARIGGLLAFQAHGADRREREQGLRTFPVVVVGQISCIGLDCGEAWMGEGLYFGQDPGGRGAYPTINFAKANIGRTLKLGAYHDYDVTDPDTPAGPARICGEVCLHAANIGKNFEIHGVAYQRISKSLRLRERFFAFCGIRDMPDLLKLSGHGLKVDRRVYFSHGSFRDKPPRGARPARRGKRASRTSETVPAAIDLWRSTIGTGFRMGPNSCCAGAVRLNSCVIGREVIIGCRSIKAGPGERAVRAREPERIPCLIDISESTITGHLRIGRHEPRHDSDSDAITVGGGISLRSTNVQGSVLFGHVTFDLQPYAPVERGTAPRQRPAAALDSRVALDLRDCICGSDMEVHSLCWVLPPLTEAERRQARERPTGLTACYWRRHAPRFAAVDPRSLVEIDLRGFQCSMLIDGFGAEWALIYRLRVRLAGMKIGDVEPASHKPPHARPPCPEHARLRWLSFQNITQEVVNEPRSPREPGFPARATGPWSGLWDSFWSRHYCAQDEDFVPQAYDVFSSAYRRGGEDATAEEILVEKKNIQNALRFRRLWLRWARHVWTWRPDRPNAASAEDEASQPSRLFRLAGLWMGLLAVAALIWLLTWRLGVDRWSSALAIGAMVLVILFWPWVVALFHLTFRFGFRYGLSPDRALLVFFTFIAVGWVSVHAARNGGFAVMTPPAPSAVGLDPKIALVLDVAYEPVSDGAEAGRASPRMLETGHAVHARAAPCNLDVNSLLYAVDMFIPLVDLDQERRCTIREVPPRSLHDRYAWWRLAKAVYELLGWVITSLVILTITGVLRRDLER